MKNKDMIESILQDSGLIEVQGMSMVKRMRVDKRKALAGRSALSICKETNPSMYARYQFFRKMYLKIRGDILKRYKSKGMISARHFF